ESPCGRDSSDGCFAMMHLGRAGTRRDGRLYHAGGASGHPKWEGKCLPMRADESRLASRPAAVLLYARRLYSKCLQEASGMDSATTDIRSALAVTLCVGAALAFAPIARAGMVTPDSIPLPPAAVGPSVGTPIPSASYLVANQYADLGVEFISQ